MSDQITIHVRTLDHKQIDLTVNKDVLVADLKALIATRCNLPVDKQRLIYKGKVLVNDKPLSEYKVQEGDALHLVTSVHSQSGGSNQQQAQQQAQQAPPQQQPSISISPMPNGLMVNAVMHPPESGELNLGQMLSSVFNSIGQANQSRQQPQPQPQPQQSRIPRNPASLIAEQSNINNQSRVTNILSIGDMLSRFHSLNANNSSSISRLSDLLRREPQLSAAERQEAQQLASILSPVLTDLHTLINDLHPLIHNLQLGSQAGQAFSLSNRPTVQGVQVHIHANANEIDTIPARLQRLQTMVNVQQPQARITGITAQPVGITLVASSQQQPQPQQQQQQAEQQQQQQQAPQNPFSAAQGGIDFSRVMQSVGPMVSNILGSMNQGGAMPQQGLPPQLGSLFSQLMGAPPQQQQQQQGAAPPSLSSVVNNISQRLGVSDQDNSVLDSLTKVALEHLDIGDLFTIVNGGDWSCMNKIKEPLKKHISEKLLNNNVSEANQEAYIESVEKQCEKSLRENKDLMDKLNEVASTSADVIIERIVFISCFYIRLVLKLFLNTSDEVYALLPQDIERNSTFPGILRQLLVLYSGELFEAISAQSKNGRSDAEAVLKTMCQNLMTGLPQEYAMFNAIGSGMVTNWILQQYTIFKQNYNVYPSKSFSKKSIVKQQEVQATPAAATVVDEDSILDEIYADEEPIMKQEAKQSAIADDDFDFDDEPKKPAASAAVAATPSSDEAWAKDLSDEQREFVKQTMARDKAAMQQEARPSSVSEAYASGSPSLKIKKETKEGGQQQQPKPQQQPSRKEDEEDDLD